MPHLAHPNRTDDMKVWEVTIQHLYTMTIAVEAESEDEAMADAYSLSEEIPFSEWEADVFTEIIGCPEDEK